MNLPNRLTVIRICLVPVFVAVMLAFPNALWATVLAAVIFLAASLTDMLDGKIARKRGLVTDFGKFLDPLADKFMVIAALLCILYRLDAEPFRTVFFVATILVVFRELAVTSMRLVISSSANIVVAASLSGKIKTVSQIVCVMTFLLEPLLPILRDYLILTWVTTVFMTVMTVWSGVQYIASYWKYLDPQK